MCIICYLFSTICISIDLVGDTLSSAIEKRILLEHTDFVEALNLILCVMLGHIIMYCVELIICWNSLVLFLRWSPFILFLQSLINRIFLILITQHRFSWTLHFALSLVMLKYEVTKA
ncbi:hypothetical protein ACJX0J_019620 [Zea mays]